MYLKNIRAHGFKSFADKTNITFNKEITAIVGPNGSGKSNVVDAIRWVLGEQSVKSLRASNIMSDVIFKGSSNRKEMSRATVSLLFDNEDNYLNADFKEVEVKREVYKTGESYYYINNQKVRLKDVQNLFLDKGVGKQSFNVISQGNISNIVSSKPTERRLVIESAAGVLRYKTRKEETERKIDKTKININTLKLLTDELNTSLKPLIRQKNTAIKYKKYKNELKNLEISLLLNDIIIFKDKYNNTASKISELNKNLEHYIFSNDSKIEKIKTNIINTTILLEEEYVSKNDLTEQLNMMTKNKLVFEEALKYKVSEEIINKNIIELDKEKQALKKRLNVLNDELNYLKNSYNKNLKIINSLDETLLKNKIRNTTKTSELNELNKKILILKNKIEILENNLKNDEYKPNSVRSIINNKLLHTHNTVASLIKYEEIYDICVNKALGNSSNFIVVDNQDEAIKCINYLKENKRGSATFLPLDIIKGRFINEDLSKYKGFINVASNIVTFNPKYKNIISNLLGNILIVDTLVNAKIISKETNFKYRIVTLEGDMFFPGGSLQGGSFKNQNVKKELLQLKESEKELNNKLKFLNNDLEHFNKRNTKIEEEFKKVKEANYLLDLEIHTKDSIINNLSKEIIEISNNLNNKNNIKLNKDEEYLLKLNKDINLILEKKEKNENKINSAKYELENLNDILLSIEKEEKENLLKSSEIKETINKCEINLKEYEIKLDTFLNRLNDEYNTTYEKEVLNNEVLDNVEESRKIVVELKNKINKLGHINLDSIDEFERINERYQFLINQKEDLIDSLNSLDSIILDMDKVMEDKFLKTFNLINKEYKIMFQNMFQGGVGELKLTNPDDLLNTGVELIACPPGKNLDSTVSLSGGEKSLAAICLLLAILNVFPVPFVILDEAEAALDEANVDLFGKYLHSKKDLTQFILITHKKRMMEYADNLYGITMQESGVSKIVSTKLK